MSEFYLHDIPVLVGGETLLPYDRPALATINTTELRYDVYLVDGILVIYETIRASHRTMIVFRIALADIFKRLIERLRRPNPPEELLHTTLETLVRTMVEDPYAAISVEGMDSPAAKALSRLRALYVKGQGHEASSRPSSDSVGSQVHGQGHQQGS